MKKLLTLLLAVALILPAAALADLPDISNLTTEELLELQKLIQQRLFSDQLNEGVKIPQGNYIGGEDIPVGNYRVVVYNQSDFGIGYFLAGDYAGGNSSMDGPVDFGKITITEGMVIEVYGCYAIFYPYSGFFF